MEQVISNRKLSKLHIALIGWFSGIACYLLAESLVPRQLYSPFDHDRLLTIRVGFIYIPLVGLWLGWLQRSVPRATTGMLIGLSLAILYMCLCNAVQNALLFMIGFPCILGGAMACLVGSNSSQWKKQIFGRTLRGLLSGLVMGTAYAVVLNVAGLFLYSYNGPHSIAYVRMMWQAGPLALGVCSSIFFVLVTWSVGLSAVWSKHLQPGEKSWSQKHPRISAATTLGIMISAGVTLRVIVAWLFESGSWAIREVISALPTSLATWPIFHVPHGCDPSLFFDLVEEAALVAKGAYMLQHAPELLSQGAGLGIFAFLSWITLKKSRRS